MEAGSTSYWKVKAIPQPPLICSCMCCFVSLISTSLCDCECTLLNLFITSIICTEICNFHFTFLNKENSLCTWKAEIQKTSVIINIGTSTTCRPYCTQVIQTQHDTQANYNWTNRVTYTSKKYNYFCWQSSHLVRSFFPWCRCSTP